MATSANVQIGKIPELVEQETGRRPSMTTVKRWIRSGYRGVRLEVKGPAHFRYCKPEWVQEFLAKCGPAVTVESQVSQQVEADTRTTERARQILANKYGFKHRRAES